MNRDRIKAMIDEGRPRSEIMAETGADNRLISQMISRVARPPKRATVKRSYVKRARISEKKPVIAAPKEIEVPAWVPRGLINDYVRIAFKQGEEAAASYARKAKRGLLVSPPEQRP